MSLFAHKLKEHKPPEGVRRWVYVPYDQLNDGFGRLACTRPGELGIVLVETTWKGNRRPYHKQKLAFILANQRHFALEQAERGVAVRYVASDQSYGATLTPIARQLGPLLTMEPAEYELRCDLAPLVEVGLIEMLPHEGWLTNPQDFRTAFPKGPPWRMDAFYRAVRKRTGILMEHGKPVGGKFSFDAENRKPWRGSPPAPAPPNFEVDPITAEVGELVEKVFADHPGRLDLSTIPATRDDAARMWQWACENALPTFGPFEDAMSSESRGLFHSRMSALINVHRILPRRVIEDVQDLDIPLASKEGFIRQVLGWREFVRHVHRETDGFHASFLSCSPLPAAGEELGVRGQNYQTASPNYLSSHNPLPDAYWPWGATSGLNCLDTVVADVWHEAYSHHITRLMVLSNIATLLDVSPRELTDWFWVAYIDAFDWVVEPNVLGMGTYALGDLMTTKPYVSGAAYINKMSDYCTGCQFDPKTNCPITRWYWAFLNRHREVLTDNPRMKLPLNAAARRSAEEQQRDRRAFEAAVQAFLSGKSLSPAMFLKV